MIYLTSYHTAKKIIESTPDDLSKLTTGDQILIVAFNEDSIVPVESISAGMFNALKKCPAKVELNTGSAIYIGAYIGRYAAGKMKVRAVADKDDSHAVIEFFEELKGICPDIEYTASFSSTVPTKKPAQPKKAAAKPETQTKAAASAQADTVQAAKPEAAGTVHVTQPETASSVPVTPAAAAAQAAGTGVQGAPAAANAGAKTVPAPQPAPEKKAAKAAKAKETPVASMSGAAASTPVTPVTPVAAANPPAGQASGADAIAAQFASIPMPMPKPPVPIQQPQAAALQAQPTGADAIAAQFANAPITGTVPTPQTVPAPQAAPAPAQQAAPTGNLQPVFDGTTVTMPDGAVVKFDNSIAVSVQNGIAPETEAAIRQIMAPFNLSDTDITMMAKAVCGSTETETGLPLMTKLFLPAKDTIVPSLVAAVKPVYAALKIMNNYYTEKANA